MRRSSFLVCLLLLSPTMVAATDATGELSAAEKTELIGMLDSSARDFVALIEKATDAQWKWKSAPERWSIGECAEHIVLSERLLYQTALDGLASPVDPDWANKTAAKAEFLKQVMPNRNPGGAGGAQAPQEIRPVEGLSRDEVLRRFAASRAEIRAFVETLEGPTKQHVVVHPFPAFGPLNSYDWLLYVPLHTVRHSRQIIEVQATAGYPQP